MQKMTFVVFVFCVLAVSGLAFAAQEDYTGLINQLQNKDPNTRIAACDLLAKLNVKNSVYQLIQTLNDENETVRIAAQKAIEQITHIEQSFGLDYKKWMEWYNLDGRKLFPIETLKEQELKSIEKSVADTTGNVERMKMDVKAAESKINFYTMVIGIVGLLFLIVILYFTGVGSSRLRTWKETIKQAEFYIKDANEITTRTNKIIEELEQKRQEISVFFSKIREENESEIGRFVEMLQTNLEHKMRETMMGLRSKAEREIAQTLGELKSSVMAEIRVLMSDHKEKSDKDFTQRQEAFSKEMESQILFVEASFYAVNGKHDDALRLYKRVLALKPDNHLALSNQGNVLKELHRYDEAIDSFERALLLSPDNPAAYYNMATIYAKLRRKDKMLTSLSKAFQLNGADYKDEALNDPVFKEYWNDTSFKNLTEA